MAEVERQAGNPTTTRTVKHLSIAAEFGHNGALQKICEIYMNMLVTKYDYTNALLAYQKFVDEIRVMTGTKLLPRLIYT